MMSLGIFHGIIVKKSCLKCLVFELKKNKKKTIGREPVWLFHSLGQAPVWFFPAKFALQFRSGMYMQIKKKKREREKQKDKTKIKYDIILGYLYQKNYWFWEIKCE